MNIDQFRVELASLEDSLLDAAEIASRFARQLPPDEPNVQRVVELITSAQNELRKIVIPF